MSVESSAPGVTQRGVGIATIALFVFSIIPLGLGFLVIAEYQFSYLTGHEHGRSLLTAFVLGVLAPIVYCAGGASTLKGSVKAGAWVLGFAIVQAIAGFFFGLALVPWLALAQIFPAAYLCRPAFLASDRVRKQRRQTEHAEKDRTWLERADWKDEAAALAKAADPEGFAAGRRAILGAGAGFVFAHLLTLAIDLGVFGAQDFNPLLAQLNAQRGHGLYALLRWVGALGSDSGINGLEIQRLLFLLVWIGFLAAALNRHAWARRALMGLGFSLAFFLMLGSLVGDARAPWVVFVAGCLDLIGATVIWRSLAVRRFFAAPDTDPRTASS